MPMVFLGVAALLVVSVVIFGVLAFAAPTLDSFDS